MIRINPRRTQKTSPQFLSPRRGPIDKSHRLKDNYLALLSEDHRDCEVLPVIESKDGLPLPQIPGPRGPLALHSRYTARKDWEKLLTAPPGLDLILGLGNGYGLISRLEEASEIWVVESSQCPAFRQSLELPGLTEALNHPKVRLLMLSPEQNLGDFIAQDYHPRIQGPLTVLANSVLLRQYPNPYSLWMKQALSENLKWKKQGKTYSFFGVRWARNMLRNLSALEKNPPQEQRANRIIITAAGPSLEKHWEAHRPKLGDLLITTDTALPWLKANKIRPWGVMTIDAQYHSLLHFAGILPEDLGEGGILQDLSTPPPLGRRYPRIQTYYSGHPFTHWLEYQGVRRPRLQMGLGNVTSVAVDLARSMGAKEIHVLGADFAYPGRNAYLKQTYIHRIWTQSQNRLASLHSLNYRLSAEREGGEHEGRWHSPVMDQYRSELESYCAAHGEYTWENGVLRFFPLNDQPAPVPSSFLLSASSTANLYREQVLSLPIYCAENQGLWEYRNRLSRDQSWVLSTLFPLISAAPAGLKPEEIFAWLKDCIGRY